MIVLLALFLFVRSQMECGIHTSCTECIANNPCGWCELNIRYEDGTLGPQCAGKPRDPDHPPPGYRPWTCPGPGFQNLYCPTYKCNNSTFTCEQLPKDTPGPQLGQCMAECQPPTYLCNKTTAQCYRTVPGFGEDLPNCQKGCIKQSYTCNKQNYQCEADPNGKDFDTCRKDCYPPTYECDSTYKCVKTVPGRGTDYSTCNSTCSSTPAPNPGPPSPSPNDKVYQCDDDKFTCSLSKNGTGLPLALCQQTCGKPSNVTPGELLGDYRGIMVNLGYIAGEWTCQITDQMVVIKNPSGQIFMKGTIGTYNSELWVFSDKGTFRTLYSIQQLPEVIQLSWAWGEPNGKAPQDWETAMSKGPVFEFSKCLSTVGLCKWNLNAHVESLIQKRAITDPCSKIPECHACIASLDYCGWCSVPVLYNGTIQGTNCGGLNKTKIPGLVCPGIFSTLDCPKTPTPPPIPAPKAPPTPPVAPTPNEPLFVCSVDTGKCRPMNPRNESGGMPISFCTLVCEVIPYVPPILVGRVWRGINIRLGYLAGEWTAAFTASEVVITDPSGKKISAKVGTTSQFLYLDLPNGNRIYSLWQLETGPSVDFLSWAFGAEKGLPPKSYNEAMVADGENEFVFSACPTDKKMPCSFKA